MSERTFRAVVAAVLVAALALAVVVAVALLPRSTEPLPSASITTSPEATPGPSVTPQPTPTPIPGPVFAAPDVVSVGLIARGATSPGTLVLKFLEPRADAIPDGPGSFQVTITDEAGDGSTVAFMGTPSIDAPGSLGATAFLVAPNVLGVSIAASDTINLEPITIRGLAIRASSTAAIGPLHAELSGFSGSLVTGAVSDVLPSPGTVTAGH